MKEGSDRKNRLLKALPLVITIILMVVLFFSLSNLLGSSIDVKDEDGNIVGKFIVEEREDGKYDLSLESSGYSVGSSSEEIVSSVEIKGSETDSINSRLGYVDDNMINTQVFAVENANVESAEITVEKFGDVKHIYKCVDFDIDNFRCNDWEKTDIPFIDNGESITFTVDGFSGYGGGADIFIGWDKKIDYVGEHDRAYDVVVDSNDDVYVVGRLSQNQTFNYDQDWWIKKYNRTGYELWEKIYNRNGGDEAIAAALDSDDNIYIAGTAENIVNVSSGVDWWIKKLDSSGNEIIVGWNKSFSGDSLLGNDYLHDIAVDSEDNVYVAGYGIDLISGGSNYDPWLMKFNSSGHKEWEKIYNFGSPAEFQDIGLDSEDNVYVVGSTSASPLEKGWLIMKFSPSGNGYWNKTLDLSQYGSGAYAVALDDEDNIYVGGFATNYVSEIPTSSADVVIKKFNSSGIEDPNLNLSFDYNWQADIIRSMIIENGSLYTAIQAGQSSGDSMWGIKKFNLSGDEDPNWNMTFISEAITSTYSHAILFGIDSDSFNDIYVAGFGTDLVDDDSGNDWWIKKFSGNLTQAEYNESLLKDVIIELVEPSSNSEVEKNKFFDFTVNVTCTDDEDCGLLNVSLDPVSWWDGDWRYRNTITIPSGKVSSDLEDFPMLVKFDSDDIDFTDAKSGGEDIRFLDSDENLLSYEIERWDSSEQKAEVWVKVPVISSTESTVLYLYYGNDDASDAQDPDDVWDDNFNGVWHLTENVSGTGDTGVYIDSTDNNNDGTDYVSSDSKIGKIQGGQGFDGDDYIDVPDDSSLDNSVYTITAWINMSSGGYQLDGIFAAQTYDYIIAGGNGDFEAIRGNKYFKDVGTNLDDGQWHHVVYKYDGVDDLFFIDGISETPGATGSASYTDMIAIGRSKWGYFDGDIDEVRVSNFARSDAWIIAEFDNTNDPSDFYNLGEKEIGSKSGLISTEIGETPFYTTTDNPYQVDLDSGESQLVTWEVNATGLYSIVHEFFAYASLDDNLYILNESERINITITDQEDPSVELESPADEKVLTVTFETFVCNVSDNYGLSNITLMVWDSEGNVEYSYSKESAGSEDNLEKQYVFSSSEDYDWNCIAYDSFGNRGIAGSNNSLNVQIPSLNIQLVDPDSNVSWTQNKFGNFTVNFSCNDYDCGEVNVTLDPLAEWSNSKLVKIDNAGNTELINNSVKIIFDTQSEIAEGDMQDDCDDIRFMDTDDSTALDYWLDSDTCDTEETEIWVKIPSIDSNSIKYIYLYMGNESAEQGSDAKGVFPNQNINHPDLSGYTDVIYVDAELGNDISGDGSLDNPYQTLREAADYDDPDDAIYLMPGTYEERGGGPTLDGDLIGALGGKVIINAGVYGNTWRRAIWLTNNEHNFYNIIFEHYNGSDGSNYYFGDVGSDSIYFYNCVFSNAVYDGLYQDSYFRNIDYVYLNNSFENTYLKSLGQAEVKISLNSVMNDSESFTLQTTSLYANETSYDSEWQLTSGEWENEGTGTNPDGTKANIGVYGGEYAWGYWGPATSVNEKGRVSTIVGDIPFYTITDNPYITDLDAGESQIITWQVNATGPIDNTYLFFVHANSTSDSTINYRTEDIYITITDEGCTDSDSDGYDACDLNGNPIAGCDNPCDCNDTELNINPGEEQCGNCIDDDADTYIDYPADTDCSSLDDTTEDDGAGGNEPVWADISVVVTDEDLTDTTTTLSDYIVSGCDLGCTYTVQSDSAGITADVINGNTLRVVPDGNYRGYGNVTVRAANLEGHSDEYIDVKVLSIPDFGTDIQLDENYFNGENTTDISALTDIVGGYQNESDPLHAYSNSVYFFSLERTLIGKVTFEGYFPFVWDLLLSASNVVIEEGYISVDSDSIFKKVSYWIHHPMAKVELYNIDPAEYVTDGEGVPIVYRDEDFHLADEDRTGWPECGSNCEPVTWNSTTGTLTFYVDEFSSHTLDKSNGQDPPGGVPEFSAIGMIIAMILMGIGMTIIIHKKK
ncbi:DUF2341 domain-containing protein [Candidatus Woesearchaeota archaeon]|nr:DUF2341 domain-containing protein [Candidatus Woesearchaeota archaeon]